MHLVASHVETELLVMEPTDDVERQKERFAADESEQGVARRFRLFVVAAGRAAFFLQQIRTHVSSLRVRVDSVEEKCVKLELF